MEIKTNVTQELANAKELLNVLQRIEDTVSKIQREAEFYTISDISRLMHISKPKAQEIFRRSDFPVIDYGKEKLVLKESFIEYMSKGCKSTDSVAKY